MIGFGTSIPLPSVLGATIAIPGVNENFTVPRATTITEIAANFSLTVATTIPTGSVAVHAVLLSAAAGSTTYAPIAGTDVTLAPDYSGILAIGATVSGSLTGLSIPIAANTKVIMAFYAEGIGLAPISVLTGNASAGIAMT